MGENWWLWLLIAFIVIVLLIWLLSRRNEEPRDMARPMRDVQDETKQAVINIEDAASDVKSELVEPAQDAIEDAVSDAKPEAEDKPAFTEGVRDKIEVDVHEIKVHIIEPVKDAANDAAEVVEDHVVEPVRDRIADIFDKDAPELPVPEDPQHLAFYKAVKSNDLTLVEGIGPRIAEVCKAAGIASFADLAKTDASRIKEILKDANLGSLADPASWPKQAELALQGNWEELKDYQDKLHAGRQ